MSALIVRIGARAPLGMTALQVAMSARARLDALRETSLGDLRGRGAGLFTTPGIDDQVCGPSRFERLGAPALRAASAGYTGSALPLFLALPGPGRPDDDLRAPEQICAALGARAGVAIDSARSMVIRQGHAGGATAMEAALALLARGAEAAIVGGIDSHVHPEVVTWLDQAHRLHSEDAENGFLPGEGAAFLRLASEGTSAARRPIARVLQARTSVETDTSIPGDTLCTLVAELSAAWTAEERGWWLCDVNGERHRVHEQTIVAVRAGLGDRAIVSRMPETLGDVGAASGAMFAVIACALWQARCAPAARALVSLSSEGHERGAIALTEVSS